jgi:Na+-driven multidrug efflux pump
MWKALSVSNVKTSWKRFDKGLFATLLARLIIPSIYTTVRVYIIGNLEEKDAINIVSQLQWVNIILEIIEEALLQPLYHCFGDSVNLEERDVIRGKVRSASFVCMMMYAVFCTLTGIFAPQLVDIMGQKDMLDEETIKYIRLELCGIFFKGMSKLFTVVLVLGKKSLYLNFILVFQLFISIISDLFFFS